MTGAGAGHGHLHRVRTTGATALPSGIEPSIYAADVLRLGEQVGALLGAGAVGFHVDVGDGVFVPPIIFGAVVVEAVAPVVHAGGGVVDCHLMIAEPDRQLEQFAAAGADHATFHLEASADPAGTVARIHGLGMTAGVAIRPDTPVDDVVTAADGADLVLCMSVHPGLSGQAFLPESVGRLAELRRRLPDAVQVQVDGGVDATNIASVRDAGADVLVAGSAVFWHGDPATGFTELSALISPTPDGEHQPQEPT